MIALYIILGILLVLFLILMIRVQVFAHYAETFTLTVKVLFFKKTLIPSPPKKKKKKPKKPRKQKEPSKKPEEKKEKEPEKKKSYLAKLREKKGLSGLVSLLTSLARIAGGLLKGLFAHIVVHRLDIGIALNSGDAASTAVNYGRLCSVVYPAVNVITAATVCKNYHVTVEPVFDSDRQTAFYADVHAHLRLIFAVHEALKAGIRLLLVRLRL